MARDGSQTGQFLEAARQIMTLDNAHQNQRWANLLIEELVRHGVRYFCISPGSRSTPLVMAVAENPQAKHFIHFDERGSAYNALGYARASNEVAAVITTSGTAVANLLPAVCEANRDDVPLILLTADRPPESIDTEANQTMDQHGIFGQQVRLAIDLPCPTSEIAEEFLVSTIDRVVATAVQERGPVHLNCRYRKPLYPAPDLGDTGLASRTNHEQRKFPLTRASRQVQIDSTIVSRIGRRLREAPRGLLVVGRLSHPGQYDAVMCLAEELGWPMLADITSGLRLETSITTAVPYYDLLLAADEDVFGIDPGMILHIGGRVVSSRLQQLLSSPNVTGSIRIDDQDRRLDQNPGVGERFTGDIARFCHDLSELLSGQSTSVPSDQLIGSEAIGMIIDTIIPDEAAPTGLSLARLVTRHITPHTGLYLGNSLAVRDVNSTAASSVATSDGLTVRVGCNRGVSGIDGTIASAAGFCRGLGLPVTVLLGDLALLHDLNSLAMLSRLPQPVTVIVNNNDGGGIFSQLPISEHHAVFETFFTTPHGLGFQAAAEQFNLQYYRPSSNRDFIDVYRQAQDSSTSSLIEVLTDRDDHQRHYRDIVTSIAQQLSSLRG